MQEHPSEFAAFIGIDWADRKHDVCLQVAGTNTLEKSSSALANCRRRNFCAVAWSRKGSKASSPTRSWRHRPGTSTAPLAAFGCRYARPT